MTEIALNTSIALVAFRNMWFCFTSHTFPSSGNTQGLSQAFFTDWELAYVGTVLEKLASRVGSICAVQFWDCVGALVAVCPAPLALVEPCRWWIGWVGERSQFGLKYLKWLESVTMRGMNMGVPPVPTAPSCKTNISQLSRL